MNGKASSIFYREAYLLVYREREYTPLRYYLGFDGQRGKAAVGAKADAVRVTLELGRKVLEQLERTDNRGWMLVYEKPRIRPCERQPYEIAAAYPRYQAAIELVVHPDAMAVPA